MEIFENAGFSFTCRPTKTEFFENDDATHHLLLVLRMLCEKYYRISIVLAFWCGRAKDSNTLRVDVYFKNIRIRVDRASDEKRYNFPDRFLKVGSTLGTGNRA